MPKPWKITSLRGNAGLSDDSEDLRGDSPEPVRDDYPDEDTGPEDRAIEAFLAATREKEPKLIEIALANFRAQAVAVLDPEKRWELQECIEAEERAKGGARLFGALPE